MITISYISCKIFNETMGIKCVLVCALFPLATCYIGVAIKKNLDEHYHSKWIGCRAQSCGSPLEHLIVELHKQRLCTK
jgi:hypothetical protein